MHIFCQRSRVQSYGNVWDDVPSELTSPVLEALSATPIPESSKYVASAPELEGVKDPDELGFVMYGAPLPARLVQRPQRTPQLPGVSPRQRALTWAPATLSCSWPSLGDRGRQLDTACVKAFRVPAGRRSLQHHAPLHALHGRQRRLPGDGGAAGGHQWPAPEAAADMPAAGDSYCYWKADKWVLCHADSPGRRRLRGPRRQKPRHHLRLGASCLSRSVTSSGLNRLYLLQIEINRRGCPKNVICNTRPQVSRLPTCYRSRQTSPNHHKGACPLCGGLGRRYTKVSGRGGYRPPCAKRSVGLRRCR